MKPDLTLPFFSLLGDHMEEGVSCPVDSFGLFILVTWLFPGCIHDAVLIYPLPWPLRVSKQLLQQILALAQIIHLLITAQFYNVKSGNKRHSFE